MGSKKEVKFVIYYKDKTSTVMEEKMIKAGVVSIDARTMPIEVKEKVKC